MKQKKLKTNEFQTGAILVQPSFANHLSSFCIMHGVHTRAREESQIFYKNN